MAAPSTPRSAPDGRKRPISRDLVLAKALDLLDTDGLDALTMRRLGQELGRDPMSIYRYAKNRADVLDGVAELVLGQLSVRPDDTDWEGQLRLMAHDLRRLALEHPNVVPLLVTRPLATPLGLRPLGTVRPLEQILSLLVTAGFDPKDALHVYRAYYGFLYGHILNELQEYVVNPDESEALLRLGLYRLPAREFPLLRALAPALAEYDGAQELDMGLNILFTGLQTQLSRHP
ncbi:TetR/AcrR family transcriptional regulator C-terminal domain-containing protein [Arthrobacter sp. BHU FT2]|nr:TetR/AcrR family transcriptional regulator C-terminal domain-containing protein [Arthrobacter sp. BHU FT2]